MSWNINKPGDYINGPLTVTGAATIGGDLILNGNENYVNLFSTYSVGSNSRVRFRAVGAGGGSGYGGDFRLSTRASNNAWNDNAFIVDSLGNLGVGGSPLAKISATVSPPAAGSDGLRIGDGTRIAQFAITGSSYNYKTVGALQPFIYGFGGPINILADGDEIKLITGTGYKTHLNSTGMVALHGGNAAANGIGIAFPAAQSASTDANTLDDYEEGTWTPSFTFATPGTLSINYGNRSGSYTKVGNLVTARFAITINPNQFSKGSASGTFIIGGLPFNIGATGAYYFDLAASLADQNTGSFVLGNPVSATNQIYFESVSISGSRILRDYAAITAANFASTNSGYITIASVIQYTV